MNEEQNPTGKEGASADARRRTHQRERGSCTRPSVGNGLTRIVDQVAFAARSPVLEAVRNLQRSWITPLLTQQHNALAALTDAALPKIVTPSYISQRLPGGFVPALGINVAQAVGRSLMPQQSVAWGLTALAQTRALVDQSVLRSLTLPDFGVSTSVLLASRIADAVRPLRDSLQQMVNGLFRQWSEVAGFGAGLARALARAALFAAMRAREAVLQGRLNEVDAFMAAEEAYYAYYTLTRPGRAGSQNTRARPAPICSTRCRYGKLSTWSVGDVGRR